MAVISVDLYNPQNQLTPSANCHTAITGHPAYYSVGVHPWHPDKNLMPKVRKYAALPSVVAIGETGLDKITADTPEGFMLQQELFLEHIHLSETIGKPLIIHCVKAWDELLHIRKITQPSAPWIIHGFRGKEALAVQLLNTGLYLSFGSFYNRYALKTAWNRHRLLIETDDKQTNIRDIYQQIADELQITIHDLSCETGVFFKTQLLIT